MAVAQVTGSVTIESQSVYRGLALDNRRPDARLSVAYDHPGGGYVGVSGFAGDTVRDGVRPLGVTVYAGFARKTADGLTWDVGVTATRLDIHLKPPPDVPDPVSLYKTVYVDGYVGLSRGGWSGRLYVSPDYLGQGNGGAYLDLSRSFVLGRDVGAYVHAGLFTPLGSSTNPYAERERFDIGAGGSWTLPLVQLRLGWTYATPSVDYPLHYRQRDNQFVMSAAHFF